jgi:hypothetical protein
MENFVLVGLFPEVNVFGNHFLDFFAGGSFAPVTNFHILEKQKLIKYE